MEKSWLGSSRPTEIDLPAMTNYSLGARAHAKALFLDKGEGDEMTKTEMEDPAHAVPKRSP